jgi:predicted enzyme related to lactoylglutathione lyase
VKDSRNAGMQDSGIAGEGLLKCWIAELLEELANHQILPSKTFFCSSALRGEISIFRTMEKRVRALGGIFFKCKDPQAMNNWYSKHLGLNTGNYGSNFGWRKADQPEVKGYTLWSPFSENTKYFAPSEKDFMINYRVDDLEKLIEVLKSEGVQVVGEIQEFEYGKFAHILDPEGNKVELWEPVDDKYEAMLDGDVTE